MKPRRFRYRRFSGHGRVVPGLYPGQVVVTSHRLAPRRSWWRRWFPLITGLALLAIAPIIAYGQEADTVVVVWTAPGDDGAIGTAASYDLRWSLTPITEANFASANGVSGVPNPALSGTRQQVTARGLTRGTTYYFALRTTDDAGNQSLISNLARWEWSLDATAPAAPLGVSAARQGESVRVQWSANSEADLRGYTIYRSTSSSGPYEPLNVTPTGAMEYVDNSLPEGAEVLWYQVSAWDVSGNESARSAPVSVRLAAAARAEWTIQESYPNPSHASDPVQIPVVNATTGAGTARIDVLDSGGRIVRRMEITLAPGNQNVTWDGKNDAGREVAPGAYRAVLNAGGKRTSIRLLRVP